MGNIDELLNVSLFVRPIFRRNSCAIDFLAASCSRLVFINSTIFPNSLSISELLSVASFSASSCRFLVYSHLDPTQRSLILCKIRWHMATVTAALLPNVIALTCNDRLMLSLVNATMRARSRPRFARRAVTTFTVF
jgi:hypothetical protein